MANRLHDRTIVVTGGASGIGAALARGFAAEGANVVVADLDIVAAEKTVEVVVGSGGAATAV